MATKHPRLARLPNICRLGVACCLLSDRVTHWSPTCVVAKSSPLASLTIVGCLPHDQIGQRESWLEGGFLSMGVGGESNVFCFYTGSELLQLCAAR